MASILIDSGTTYLKIVTINDNDEIIDRQEAGLSSLEEKVNYISTYLENISAQRFEIVDVAISTEMHGFILISNSGEKLCDYISWRHECSDEILNEISNRIEKNDILKSGMPLKTGIASTSLFEYKKHNNVDSAIMLTLGDYYIYKLTGAVPSLHPTNAAATGLYDLIADKWNREYINALGFNNIVFPKVETGNIIEKELNGVVFRFHEAIGDQQATLLGAGLDSNSISINMGTGSQLSVVVDKLLLSEDYQTRPYFNNTYLLTVPYIPCGRALNVYFRFIKDVVLSYNEQDADENRIWKILMNFSDDTSFDSEILEMDMGFFNNAITNSSMGSISRITEENFTLSNFSVSIASQMVKNYVIAAKIIPISDEMKNIIFTGGVARKNPKLVGKIADGIGVRDYSISNQDALDGLKKYIEMDAE